MQNDQKSPDETAPLSKIDVITVADLSGPKGLIFEARLIFFLVNWIENAGKARHFPLHLACIGEPSPQIEWLAKRANAHVTIHKPHPLADRGRFINKLRGFEINRQTDYFLLLDTDVWVLSDFSSLTELGHTIAVAPSIQPRIPTSYWLKIYEGFNMELPTERIRSTKGEYGCGLTPFGLPYPGQEAELSNMLPYYNCGVIYGPWNDDLPTKWVENAQRIAHLFPNGNRLNEAYKAVRYCDQASFALAIEQLKREGVSFTHLPTPFHTHFVHLYAKDIKLSDVKLYHAFSFALDPIRPLSHYAKDLSARMWREWRLQYPNKSVLHYLRHFFIFHTITGFSLISRLRKAYKTHFGDVYSVFALMPSILPELTSECTYNNHSTN